MPKTFHIEQSFTDALSTCAPGLPAPERECHFARPRRWRADFAWTDQRVLVEIEGIYGAKSRHHTATGYSRLREIPRRDCPGIARASLHESGTGDRGRAGDGYRGVVGLRNWTRSKPCRVK
ncbi:MAG: hypothetical protein H7145_22175 [Akkermansiaceae bacterium]|nr:hypothetical protein [Armatimonadota bacterium]